MTAGDGARKGAAALGRLGALVNCLGGNRLWADQARRELADRALAERVAPAGRDRAERAEEMRRAEERWESTHGR